MEAYKSGGSFMQQDEGDRGEGVNLGVKLRSRERSHSVYTARGNVSGWPWVLGVWI